MKVKAARRKQGGRTDDCRFHPQIFEIRRATAPEPRPQTQTARFHYCLFTYYCTHTVNSCSASGISYHTAEMPTMHQAAAVTQRPHSLFTHIGHNTPWHTPRTTFCTSARRSTSSHRASRRSSSLIGITGRTIITLVRRIICGCSDTCETYIMSTPCHCHWIVQDRHT